MEMTREGSDPRSRSLAVAENLTLWSVLATVSLFTTGQIAHAYEFNALGLHGLRVDVAWQERVFEGGIAILNMFLNTLLAPRLMHLQWLGATAIFVVCIWCWNKSQARPRARRVLGALAGCAYLTTLILLGIGWGRWQAKMIREGTSNTDHFVFTPDAAARLPPSLLQDNEQRKLLLVAATPDFLVLLSADRKTSYRVATRDLELQETTTNLDEQ